MNLEAHLEGGGNRLCYPEVLATPSTGAVSRSQCQVPMVLEGKEEEFHWLPAITLRVPANHILKGSRADLAKQGVGVGKTIQPLTLLPAKLFFFFFLEALKKESSPGCWEGASQDLGRSCAGEAKDTENQNQYMENGIWDERGL